MNCDQTLFSNYRGMLPFMSKFNLIAAILFLPLTILKADETVWKARVTVEGVDGKKTQSVSAFMPDDQVKLPIIIGRYGECTIAISFHSDQGLP